LLAGIIIASDRSVVERDMPRNEAAERLYERTAKMVARIKRELSNG
jgi:hypothetical protein